jgi:hypothetical protein
MTSDTSSDLNMNLNNTVKKESSETDYYLNLIANPNKTLIDEPDDSPALKLSDTENNSSSTTSKPSFENIKIISSPKKSKRSSPFDNKHSSKQSSHGSSEVKHHFRHSVTSPPIPLNPQQQRMRKIELLRKLSDLKTKGYKLSKDYDFSSSIEEMEYEYDLLRSFADRRNGVKLYKGIILNVCSAIEFTNENYNPFDFRLNGWSDHMNVEVDNYDDVLEELYEKYRGAGGSMPPEMKLFLLILASASAFHFSKKMNSPIISKVYGGMGSQFVSNMMGKKEENSNFISEQELNIKRQKEELKQQEIHRKELLRQRQQQQSIIQEESLNNNNIFPNKPHENYRNAYHPVNLNPGPPSNINPNNDQRPIINKNKEVNDILKQIHDEVETELESSVTASVNDRLLSETTVSETSGRRKRKKKKPMMVIT